MFEQEELEEIRSAKAAWEAEGKTWQPHPSEAVVDKMIDELGREGKAAGAGFYEYPESGNKYLWSGLKDAFGGNKQLPFRDMQERMMIAEALDTVRCFDEGVIESVADANIGSIFGIGFPAWTGGVVQYMNQYEGGLKGFVERARELARDYGERFEPPQSLVDRAEKSETFE